MTSQAKSFLAAFLLLLSTDLSGANLLKGPMSLTLSNRGKIQLLTGYTFTPAPDPLTSQAKPPFRNATQNVGIIRKDRANWQLSITFIPKADPKYVDTFRLSVPQSILFRQRALSHGQAVQMLENDTFDLSTMSLNYVANLSPLRLEPLPSIGKRETAVTHRIKLFLCNDGILIFELAALLSDFGKADKECRNLFDTFAFLPGARPQFDANRTQPTGYTDTVGVPTNRSALIIGPTLLKLDDTASIFVPPGYRFWNDSSKVPMRLSKSEAATAMRFGSLHGCSLTWSLDISEIPNGALDLDLHRSHALAYKQAAGKLGFSVDIIENDHIDRLKKATSYVVEISNPFFSTRRRVTEYAGRHKRIVAELTATREEFDSADRESQRVLASFNFQPAQRPFSDSPGLSSRWTQILSLLIVAALGLLFGALAGTIRIKMLRPV